MAKKKIQQMRAGWEQMSFSTEWFANIITCFKNPTKWEMIIGEKCSSNSPSVHSFSMQSYCKGIINA